MVIIVVFDVFAFGPEAVFFVVWGVGEAAGSVLFAGEEGACEFAAVFVVDVAVAVLFVEGE